MKIFYFSFLLALASLQIAKAQITFQKTYGNYVEDGKSLQQTSDSGFILFGNTTSYGVTSMLLVKTDAFGNEIWEKPYDGIAGSSPSSMQVTTDSGYILCGGIDSIELIKTDAFGHPEWEAKYTDSLSGSAS